MASTSSSVLTVKASVGFLQRGPVDESPLARTEIDPAVPVQQLQSFPDGNPAHAKALCKMGLDQVLTAREVSEDDELLERVVDLLPKREWLLEWPERL